MGQFARGGGQRSTGGRSSKKRQRKRSPDQTPDQLSPDQEEPPPKRGKKRLPRKPGSTPDPDPTSQKQLVEEVATLRAEIRSLREGGRNAALRRSEESLRNAQRIAHLGNWDWNLKTQHLYWSDENYRIFGLEPGETIDYRAFLDFIHPEDRQHLETAVAAAFDKGGPFTLDYRIITRNGENRTLTGEGEVEFDANGTPIRMSGTAQDVTERRQIEATLARYRERLEDLVEERTRDLAASQQKLRDADRMASLGTLASGIAHQLNDPIAVILLAAEYARQCEGDPDFDSIANKVFDDVVGAARRCEMIVQSVLQFARGDSLERWSEDLSGIVQRACILAGRHAGERSATIEFELPEQSLPVHMSPIEMEHVIVILLRNGVESRKQGARVRVSARAVGDRAQFTVEDDGRGIAPDECRRIFDPFFTTRLSEGGSGLGLSIAHGIVQAHNGTIGVHSLPGRGSTFTVELPLAGRG